jgi:hypothetical protein
MADWLPTKSERDTLANSETFSSQTSESTSQTTSTSKRTVGLTNEKQTAEETTTGTTWQKSTGQAKSANRQVRDLHATETGNDKSTQFADIGAQVQFVIPIRGKIQCGDENFCKN